MRVLNDVFRTSLSKRNARRETGGAAALWNVVNAGAKQ